MPKINEVVNKHQLPPLQQNVLNYLLQHDDEVFSYADAEELRKKIGHNGSVRGVVFSLWDLHRKGLLDNEKLGRRTFYGSKEAITELRKLTKQQRKSATIITKPLTLDIAAIPGNIPKALAETLEMIYFVKKNDISRIEATTEIARRRNIARQTVIDKYCRQLDKTASEIDRLLEEGKLEDFRSLLQSKFQSHSDTIEEFFKTLVE